MRLEFADSSIDMVTAALVVHFMSDPTSGVAEMARVARTGGTVAGYAWDLAGGGFPLPRHPRGDAIHWLAGSGPSTSRGGRCPQPGTTLDLCRLGRHCATRVLRHPHCSRLCSLLEGSDHRAAHCRGSARPLTNGAQTCEGCGPEHAPVRQRWKCCSHCTSERDTGSLANTVRSGPGANAPALGCQADRTGEARRSGGAGQPGHVAVILGVYAGTQAARGRC
jgi:hypothetical protein